MWVAITRAKMVDRPERVLELIERFEGNIGSYHSEVYNEAQLRCEFEDAIKVFGPLIPVH